MVATTSSHEGKRENICHPRTESGISPVVSFFSLLSLKFRHSFGPAILLHQTIAATRGQASIQMGKLQIKPFSGDAAVVVNSMTFTFSLIIIFFDSREQEY